MKRWFFISFVVFILVCYAAPANPGARYPILGSDVIEGVAILEDHSEALVHWAKKGIKDAVLFNIDAHDDRRWISDEKIETLKALYNRQDWTALRNVDSMGDKSLYHVGNFIYAAARLGIIKEIYWMIPFSYFSQKEIEDRLREFLRLYNFSEEDIRTFRREGACFRGRTLGIPMTVFGLEYIPAIAKPIILSIDMDFFPPMVQAYGFDKTTAIRNLFKALYQKKYAIQHALIAYSVKGGYVSVVNRWIGEACLEVLKNPGMVYDNPPKLWMARQHGDNYYEENNASALLNHSISHLENYEEDPSLVLYAGFAYLGMGNVKQAFNFAKKACLIHSGYCYGLADMGQCLLDTDRLDDAVRFFECVYTLSPGMTFRQANYADALKKAGRYREALLYFERYRSRHGSFPVEFLIGETFLLMGDASSAMAHFERGTRYLDNDPYASVKNQKVADAILRAIAFYEQKGFRGRARALKEHPKLKTIFAKHK
ncbi:MAG: tetratricopeptide repeat protein [Desulfobacteraceae bacterium]|jgi:tetratricopeptide (TPR) repeat protein